MFFSKKAGLATESKYGRIYVFKITLDTNIIVYKVGMTHSDRSLDRMLEVLRSFFKVNRYVPRCEIRRDKKVLIPRLIEKHLHELLNEWSYTFEKSFDGSTEFFKDIHEDVLLEYLDSFTYNLLLQDKTTISEKELQAIRDALDTVKPPKPEKSDIIPF